VNALENVRNDLRAVQDRLSILLHELVNLNLNDNAAEQVEQFFDIWCDLHATINDMNYILRRSEVSCRKMTED